jgi:DDE superfamily endonuclease
MGPEGAKSFPGRRLVRAARRGSPRARAHQEVDYGRRGSGYVFGAFQPAIGAAFTASYPGRTIANWLDFLDRVDAWLPTGSAQVYAILDNLSTHRALDILLWALVHPRWEFVFQPIHAAYLNLIEPWWKILRSLALKGRRFADWDELRRAVAAATVYWNAHRHPFVWGRRHSPRSRRPPGVARVPLVA